MNQKLDERIYRRWRTHGATPERVAAALLRQGAPRFIVANLLANVFDRPKRWARGVVFGEFRPLRREIRDPRIAYLHLSDLGYEAWDAFDIVAFVYRLSRSRAKSVMLSAELARGNDIQRTLAEALHLFDQDLPLSDDRPG